MSDYVTDTRSVLDQALRVLQAMVDVAADGGWMYTAMGAMQLSQMVSQARFIDGPQLADLPHLDARAVSALGSRARVSSLSQLQAARAEDVRAALRGLVGDAQIRELLGLVSTLPRVSLSSARLPTLARSAEASLSITLTCTNAASRRHAYAPRFPKPRQGGWWLMVRRRALVSGSSAKSAKSAKWAQRADTCQVGEEEELFALKRVRTSRGTSTAELKFTAPDEAGTYSFDLFLVSDTYIGLDQRATVQVTVA